MVITKFLSTSSKKNSNIRDKKNRLKKKEESSDDELDIEISSIDSDEDDSEDDDSDYDSDEEEEEDSEDNVSYEDEDVENNKKITKSKKKDEKKNELDDLELKKYLANIFPSKYMNDKVKKAEKQAEAEKHTEAEKQADENKKKTKDSSKESVKTTKSSSSSGNNKNSEDTKDKDSKKDKNSKKDKTKEKEKKEIKNVKKDKEIKKNKDCKSSKNKDNKKSKKEIVEDSDSEDEEYDSESDKDSEEDEDEDADSEKNSDSDSDSEDEKDDKRKKSNKMHIVFNIRDEDNYDDEDDEDFENECLLYENEDENEECGSDDEKTFMKENYQEVVIPEDIIRNKKEIEMNNDKQNKKKNGNKEKKDKKEKDKKEKEKEEEIPLNRESEYLELNDLKKHLIEKLNKKPTSKILLKTYEKCQKEINKLVKSARFENTKRYHKLINSEKKKTNEIEYFKKKLSNKEQMTIMNDLKEINKHIYVEKPYRLTLLQSNLPANLKAVAFQKLNLLRSMDPIDSEYFKIKNWIDTFMKIPFGVYKSLSIQMSDGIDVCNDYIVNSKKILDDCVYGLDDAKMQIMQLLGQWISNPSALGTAIAIKGPMGTGKTTIVKEGISKILGREFTFIALGGSGDSSFLEGHSYTYEGSTWGKIVQIIIDSKCMNPIIYFDELDKISDTARGQEIIGILTHLTDTSQNSQFHDKYFSEIDFDLSKCLFIFSYNDENLVNPILKDRMYRIQTKGYDSKEKIVIARNYLLPKIREQVNFSETDIVITDDIIQYLVQTEGFTKKEDGVRNLKRCLEIIYTKLNLFRLVKPEVNIFGKQLDLEVTFPFTVTRKVVDILIKNDDEQKHSLLAMYV